MSSPRPGGREKAIDEQVAYLFADGHSQGSIARHMGVSRWQIRKAGERLNLEWDRETTEVAVAAAAEHARRDRERLAQRYLDLSHDFLDQVDDYRNSPNPSHAWEALKSAATSTDKLVALHALSARHPVDQDGLDMRESAAKLDAFMAGTLAAVQATSDR